MPKQLNDSVVVITGASSGIGRLTAIEFAKEGTRLVLAARGKSNLREVAEECEELGAETLVIECDVSDPDEVRRLARQAVKQFRRIDVWVNNAGVGLYGRIDEVPEEAYRQVIETNLFGQIYGARAAIEQFKELGQGVLINVSSQVAFGGTGYSSAYVISKYGVRALSDALRQELRDTNIEVVTIYPASTDTPFFENAGNYTGRTVKPLGKVHKPEEVAKAIVKAAREPKPDVLIGNMGYITEPMHWIAPRAHSRFIGRKSEQDHFMDEPERPKDGNLYRASKHAAVTGGWREEGGGVLPIAVGLGAAAAAGTIWALVRGRRKPHPAIEDMNAA
jgi:short-subunit dehydrogenase